ncbi:hypothetical protein ACVWXN_002220 [Bradyrhizobium sp. i1.4.4]
MLVADDSGNAVWRVTAAHPQVTQRWISRSCTMGLAQYAIVPVEDEWGVLHDGDVKSKYATKEAAFESAVAAASLAIRQGHEVHVSVPGREAGENALGS